MSLICALLREVRNRMKTDWKNYRLLQKGEIIRYGVDRSTIPERPIMSNEQGGLSRKIELPDYCCPRDVWTQGGDPNCDHDYPPESKVEHAEFVQWKCSKCKMQTCFGVYQ